MLRRPSRKEEMFGSRKKEAESLYLSPEGIA